LSEKIVSCPRRLLGPRKSFDVLRNSGPRVIEGSGASSPELIRRLPRRNLVRQRGKFTAGFTLLEIVAVIAIVAMLAAVLLPLVPRATTRQRLAAFAVEAAALLKADRTAAVRRSAQINAQIDAPGRVIRSGSTGRILQIPGDVAFQALLPLTCNERPARSTISFFATGMSCGGTIVLSRLGVGFEVRVNWLTGGIEVAARNAPST
jgi:general secretion pathway protein H